MPKHFSVFDHQRLFTKLRLSVILLFFKFEGLSFGLNNKTSLACFVSLREHTLLFTYPLTWLHPSGQNLVGRPPHTQDCKDKQLGTAS